jgi:hypothetical protein
MAARMRATAETRHAEEDDDELEILAPNWDAVAVWQICEPDVLPTFGKQPLWLQPSAREILAGCQLMQIDPDRWPDTTARVRIMGKVSARIRNANSK